MAKRRKSAEKLPDGVVPLPAFLARHFTFAGRLEAVRAECRAILADPKSQAGRRRWAGAALRHADNAEDLIRTNRASDSASEAFQLGLMMALVRGGELIDAAQKQRSGFREFSNRRSASAAEKREKACKMVDELMKNGAKNMQTARQNAATKLNIPLPTIMRYTRHMNPQRTGSDR